MFLIDKYAVYYRNIAFYVVWVLAISSVFFLVSIFILFSFLLSFFLSFFFSSFLSFFLSFSIVVNFHISYLSCLPLFLDFLTRIRLNEFFIHSLFHVYIAIDIIIISTLPCFLNLSIFIILGFISITPMDETSKNFNVLVDDHFSSSAVSESHFHDFGKISMHPSNSITC